MLGGKVGENFMEHFSTSGENLTAQVFIGSYAYVEGAHILFEDPDLIDKTFGGVIAFAGFIVMSQSLDKILGPRLEARRERKAAQEAVKMLDLTDQAYAQSSDKK